jgi:2-polyprenyl-3-methyl-5-hydroxy-6-metoxy-1,4-benzoquinol methylase
MSLRINLGRGLIRMGAFVQSLAVVVMKPNELIEFSRQSYARPQNISSWVEDDIVDSGLSEDENNLIAAVPVRTGDLLLLGVGGGREAVPLARMGFRVTGVDYIPTMVSKAVENADRRGVNIEGLVQEISQLDVKPGAYDVVWLSRDMYSCVPTRERRVKMVRKIALALRPGGLFLCQFRWYAGSRTRGKSNFIRRVVAACTLGNLAYEAGDMLWGNIEFVHQFLSEDAIRSELEEGGLSVLRIQIDQKYLRGGAVCKNIRANG